MSYKMRKPTVKNKYDLTIAKLKKYVVADRTQLCPPLFWRNDVISAWCICGSTGNEMDRMFGTNSEFWIGIYDEDAKAYAGKFRFNLSAYGGMCGYTFKQFFQSSDIDNENDMRIQELFLEKINQLIDCGIIKEKEN